MRNGRCRLHGGKSPGPPIGNTHALKHGRYARAAIQPPEEQPYASHVALTQRAKDMKKLTAATYLERRSALRLELEAAKAHYADRCRLAATGECSDADHRQAKSDLDLATDKLASLEAAREEQCRVDRLGEAQAAQQRWEADRETMLAEAREGVETYGLELANIIQRLRVIGEDYRARRTRVKAIANRHKPTTAGLRPGEGLMRFAAHRDMNNNADMSEKSAANEVEKLLGAIQTIADDALQALNAGRPDEPDELEAA